jgi:hypothetical protein
MTWFLVALALLSSALGLLLSVPNFSPVLAMALFVGFHATSWRARIWLSMATLLIGDLVQGLRDPAYLFHDTMWATYSGMALLAVIGWWASRGAGGGFWRQRLVAIGLGATAFFVLTNFAVWWAGGLYPDDLSGLWMSWVMGLPFFDDTLTSTGLFLFTFEGLKKLWEARQGAMSWVRSNS